MRITVYDVLGWLAAGMSIAEIIDDFPELTETDIIACLEFAADRDHRLVASAIALNGKLERSRKENVYLDFPTNKDTIRS